jgi:hypothetical protein
MDHEYRADISMYPFEKTYVASELASRARELAAEVAKDLFAMFGWFPPLELLRQEQAELRPRR